MHSRKLIGILSAAVSAATLTSYWRFRKEMRAVRDALEAGSTIAETAAGEIEYAESGQGEPMLVIHGAGGGFDQGLLIGRGLGDHFRLIAPSRFGYLGTAVPEDCSPAAQADAHAALLDFLDVEQAIVVGVSAGAPSALELALKHPERVSALILLVPRTYAPGASIGVDESAPSQLVLKLVEDSADFLFWLAIRIAPRAVIRFLGVPPELEEQADQEERNWVARIMDAILPLSSRVRGLEVDGRAEIGPLPLERISAPTLVVSAKDDLFKTLPGARFTAEHIPGAELHVLESGGHLMVGQTKTVSEWVKALLSRRRSRSAGDRHVGKVLEPVR